jgi:hypothetical protein
MQRHKSANNEDLVSMPTSAVAFSLPGEWYLQDGTVHMPALYSFGMFEQSDHGVTAVVSPPVLGFEEENRAIGPDRGLRP